MGPPALICMKGAWNMGAAWGEEGDMLPAICLGVMVFQYDVPGSG